MSCCGYENLERTTFLTKKDVVKILRNHSMSKIEIDAFFKDLGGFKDHYKAGEINDLLGY